MALRITRTIYVTDQRGTATRLARTPSGRTTGYRQDGCGEGQGVGGAGQSGATAAWPGTFRAAASGSAGGGGDLVRKVGVQSSSDPMPRKLGVSSADAVAIRKPVFDVSHA